MKIVWTWENREKQLVFPIDNDSKCTASQIRPASGEGQSRPVIPGQRRRLRRTTSLGIPDEDTWWDAPFSIRQ